ncbi:MAG: precorrin-3B C(17)-methyltransferase, partial [Bacteroidales bacterium]|nr:precorrin-3B C(17)-methyltransferase [Bacteroidales bacterium]
MSKISVIGIGPGSKEDMTPSAVEAIVASDVVVSYKYYMQFVKPLLKEGTKLVDTGMKQERERVAIA